MMGDVDALGHRFGPLVSSHLKIATYLKIYDEEHHPSAYQHNNLHCYTSSRLKENVIDIIVSPILTTSFISSITESSLSVINQSKLAE